MAGLTDERRVQPADETTATLAKPAPGDPLRIGLVRPVEAGDEDDPETTRVANAGA
jgi:hypothetical protein